jgi:hypothetical protein
VRWGPDQKTTRQLAESIDRFGKPRRESIYSPISNRMSEMRASSLKKGDLLDKLPGIFDLIQAGAWLGKGNKDTYLPVFQHNAEMSALFHQMSDVRNFHE